MIKKIACVVSVVALVGCAPAFYVFEGQKYRSKEAFHQAVENTLSGALTEIAPLPAPVAQKKLVFAIASEKTMIDESVRRFAALEGSQPNPRQRQMLENITKANFKSIKMFYDAVQKKNVFSYTQLIELQSTNGSVAASADSDALYYLEPSQGSGQWYYDSTKYGKQIFVFDRSSPTSAGKTRAFVEAVQALAIRD